MKIRVIRIGTAGGSFVDDVAQGYDMIILAPEGGAVTLAAPVALTDGGNPLLMRPRTVMILGGFTLNSQPFTLYGRSMSAQEVIVAGSINAIYDNVASAYKSVYSNDIGQGDLPTIVDLSSSLAGATVTLNVKTQSSKIILTGSGTLTGDLTVALSTSGVLNGDDVEVYYAANIVKDGFNFVVQGQKVSDQSATLSNWKFDGIYSSTLAAWLVRFVNLQQTTSKASFFGQATASGGAGFIGPNENYDSALGYDDETQALSADFAAIRVCDRLFSEAEVSAMTTGTVTIVTKSGDAGKAIQIVSSVNITAQDVVSPYTGSPVFQISYDGASRLVISDPDILETTISERTAIRDSNVSILAATGAETQVLPDADLVASISGVTTAGQMKIRIRFLYRYM